ncbi:PAS and helix-turn-helix domain-containing protein [Bordetella bronchialis]|uniref:Helix-turn-helix transcriptional regulator n=1 Tax=Bordetella bronchialis TaxID=463025 RepID=A0A193FY45_9BORD|nr:PAS and helix-turn-helix domain-containing protein [Bordetella bronchialis]ANN67202.1 helix-turn-helix transcriptional regulator [Bordetella bronchialis]ANN72288.1 helix-turn-helix transcriptional regulator [Bordetella bronchialis]
MSSPDIDYKEVLMRAPVGMCVSHNRVIRIANLAMEDMFGYGRQSLDGISFEILYPTAQEFVRTGRRLLASFGAAGTYADERIMKRREGELFWCHATGRALVPEDPHAAVIWAFEDLSATRPVASGLSAREREIAALIAEGKTSKEIARQLGLSPRTVEMYRARLMNKFGAKTSAGLIHKLMSFSAA